MASLVRALLALLVILVILTLGHSAGAAAEMRYALVIGNDQYRAAPLTTPADDAGLVADALQAAGFTVTGARDLDQATLRETFREFLDQVSAAGPDAVALVYLAGYGLQFQGENYFVPVDADIQRDVDVPLQAIRISDFTQPLAALPGRVKIVILDAARQNPFARAGQPLAGGLALVNPAPSMAIAFNAAPGTLAPDEPGPYGAFASALTEMIAAGGLSLDDIFARVRLRVSNLTQGAEVPWYASAIDGPFFMTELAAGAPPPPNAAPIAEIRSRPMRDYRDADDAYTAALALDTFDGYQEFLTLFPDSPYAARVAAMLAVRREEIIWRHCAIADTPPAYWSYLRRYPDGPHVWDARRRLAELRAQIEAPADFPLFDFGVPPPPQDELAFVDRPVVIFEGPRFRPPPPPPAFFLPPRPREFDHLQPPPRSAERFALPVPAVAVVPAFIKPPRTVEIRPSPPGPEAKPSGRPASTVSLPAAVSRTPRGGPSTPGTPGVHPEIGAPAAVAPSLPHPGVPGAPPPPPPSSAFVKPAPPPPHPTGPVPAFVKPPAPPSPPAPAPVPPPHPAPRPAFVKPTPPTPPHPAPAPAYKPPPHPAPVVSKPPPPPPHPAAKPVPPPPHPAAKPSCPAGKTATPSGCK